VSCPDGPCYHVGRCEDLGKPPLAFDPGLAGRHQVTTGRNAGRVAALAKLDPVVERLITNSEAQTVAIGRLATAVERLVEQLEDGQR
jgi:hypothetical protein